MVQFKLDLFYVARKVLLHIHRPMCRAYNPGSAGTPFLRLNHHFPPPERLEYGVYVDG